MTMGDADKPKEPISARTAMALQDKIQAERMSAWGHALEKAKTENDWAAVDAVRHGLLMTSIELESFTSRLLDALAARGGR